MSAKFYPKVLIIILSLLLGFSSLTKANRIREKAFYGEMNLSKSPDIGEEATLTLSFDSLLDESFKADIRFWIPNGISARTQTKFDDAYIHARTTGNRYSVVVLVNEIGNYTFRASIYARLSNGRLIRQHFYTHLLVTSTSSQKSQSPFNVEMVNIGSSRLNTNINNRKSAIVNQQSIQVVGSVSYFDINESKLLPVKGLKMILVKDNLLIDEELATSYTDDNGRFEFTPISKNLDVRLDLYIVASFDNDIVYITNRSNRIYELESDIARDVKDDLEFELELDQKPELGSIFNTITKVHNFFLNKSGWSRRRLQVVWPASGNISYYYVEALGKKITAEKLNIIEEDAWEKITIYHEYGHSVMTAAYENDLNALPQSDYNKNHWLHTVSDPDFAMSEGWAEFVEAAVEDNALNVTGYINANEPNIETNKWWTGDNQGNGNNKAGENVEGAVASILWDITDTKDSIDLSPNIDDDGIDDMFPQLWTIFVEDRPTSITDIAVGWRNRSFPKLNELESIYAEHHALSKINSPPVVAILNPSQEIVADDDITIRWNVNEPDGDDYKVDLLSTYQNRKFSIISSLSSNVNEYSWNIQSLREGVYNIIIQAVDSHGATTQETSDSKIFIDHSPLMPPEVFSNTHPEQSKWYADNSPSFEFNTSPENDSGRKYSYIIDRETDTIPDKRYDHIGNSLEIQGLTDSEWYLHIRALDELGYWTEPSHFSVKIDTSPPPTVKNVVWDRKDGNVILLWDSVDDVSGIQGYQVRVDVNSFDFSEGLFYDDFSTNTQKTFELPPGSTYYAKVKAKNGAGLLSRNWSILTSVEIEAVNPYDINKDGKVDIFDLVLVAKNFGRIIEEPIAENPDVNNDGKVDIFDLVLIGSHFGETQENMASSNNIIAKSEPQTRLYQNYPNPFNPETWIPYTLENDTKVTIKIYEQSGKLVREIFRGYQKAGDYTNRTKAAFWDGKNKYGEEVPSGIYFYTLQAENNPPLSRKMLIVK